MEKNLDFTYPEILAVREAVAERLVILGREISEMEREDRTDDTGRYSLVNRLYGNLHTASIKLMKL